MKGWVFSLVLLIGWLSMVPCCVEAGHEASAIDTCEEKSQQEEEECPLAFPCSPFYSCGSCVGCIAPNALLLDILDGSDPVAVLFFESSFKLPAGSLFLPLKPPRPFVQFA